MSASVTSTSAAAGYGGRPQPLYEPSQLLFVQVDRQSSVPQAAQALCAALNDSEAAFTSQLDAKVKLAWTDVEDVVDRNKRRLASLEVEADDALASMGDISFWTVDGVQSQFLGNSTMVENDQDEDGAASADFMSTTTQGAGSAAGLGDVRSMLSTANVSDALLSATRSDATRALSKQLSLTKIRLKSDRSRAAARHHQSSKQSNGAAARDLIDAASSGTHHVAPIRRLFRDLLSRRSELPKELTILLNMLEEMQKKEMVLLEAQLEESSLEIPIHVPLARIALLLHRQFVKPSRGAMEEETFLAAVKPLLKELDESFAALRILWSAEDMTSITKADATGVMWKTLLTELATRRDLQQDCEVALDRVAAYETELGETLSTSMSECKSQILSDLKAIQADAATVEGSAKETFDRAEAARMALENAYKTDRAAIDTALQGTKYQIQASLQAQEKCARRVREAYKEFHREQIKHQHYVTSYLHLKTVSRQIDVSAQQLQDIVVSKLDKANAAKSTSTHLQTLISSTQSVCDALLSECEHHAARITTEEHYRKRRVVGYGTDNLSKWLRCANDLGSLYSARNDAVRAKSESSWQLDYLLTQERQRCGVNLDAVRDELRRIDSVWSATKDRMALMQLPIPTIERAERTDEAMQMRMVLGSVDDDSVVSKVNTQLADATAVAALSRAPAVRAQWETLRQSGIASLPASPRVARSTPSSVDKKPLSARLPLAQPPAEGLFPRLPTRSTANTPRPPHRDAHQLKSR
ncbi:Hypothetical protein, putative [Bodo saltans]|uniref:Uncharacterized protein n=1 Tax=Bodo saltans TaxID=75058 RepID=A0A0S4JLD6_BODSA|nr:Hypothetical protein, putative [Bodo saltans]|eukprot:CUG91409.1 Hypothetical protein, putative [Bodo saltans]